ncbi:hypothetical protein MSAN_01197800 [Mycena sanguinolenta]|uniref:DUF6535 domain-containing protein n=1 Tax=Mycena sanguinolenta TaxID=230812 RepID=A0A8H6YCK2_9AGAR|nr:hypothetical protein MSAN_01197800 [Mycena sanguinolenta]
MSEYLLIDTDVEAAAGEQTRADEDDAAGAKIWSVYIAEAERYDKALVESWKSDMDGMLIFAGLFSAILTAFLIESYTTLSPDSGDTTILLLTQISNQLGGIANGSSVVIPPPPTFVTPVTSLVCNTLWFISLGLSLSCALIATLVQQWAREFLHKSEMRSAPILRARILTYLYYGLKRFNMHAVVEVIPFLLHASLIIFFAGLVAFLVPVNTGIMILCAFLLGAVVLGYSFLTVFPLLWYDAPYRTPLSGGLWQVVQTFKHLSQARPSKAEDSHQLPEVSMVEAMFHVARRKSEQRDVRDHRALCWTVRSLADDEELEPFIEGIPDALWSSHGRRNGYNEHLEVLLRAPEVRLLHRIEDFLRGCHSDLLSTEVQFRRRVTALKALWAIATIPRNGLSLQPLEPFDGTLLRRTTSESKVDHYQLSTRTVMDLNVLLSIGGDINVVTQSLTIDGTHPDAYHVSTQLGRVISKLDRLPRDAWQSSTDREAHENLIYLHNNPPPDASGLPSWVEQCLDALTSISQAVLAIEYQMFASFMIDAAALESWPYEFEATRATFSFDESTVPADVADIFSIAFDSVVSDQSRRSSYSAHAEEILTILLSICASAMRDDPTYFPVNLTSYLTTQKAVESRVLQKCDPLWLCGCLTAELVVKEHASPLLSGPVVDALWEIAYLMANQYLNSWKYRCNPLGSIRALQAVRSAAISRASPSTIALLQTNVLNAMSPLPHDFDNFESVHMVPIHPILSEDHGGPFSARNGNVEPEQTDEPMLSILSLRVIYPC